ncbi:MAG: proteasome-type protease [Gammaproteobacteria bacterium]|nr:proteasome-type protease [Gammaproteobacteria bacterium]MDE2250027.1 proteasome-type protease [Gammaproteobacteria bacterium]
MTYCVGIRLNAGMVFVSDSRTNAGLDQIGTFRKMIVYERPGDRFIAMLSAGNLSVSQSIRELLQVESLPSEAGGEPLTIWNATSMFDVARLLGATVRRVQIDDGPALQKAGVEFNASMILGGQIRGEAMRMFLVYAAGNFIEATRETCYFQIGESKYGKPVLDRLIVPTTTLAAAAKGALVSMDSTMKANLSVGLPLDLLVYRDGSLANSELVCIDEQNPYFQMIRSTWGQRLREVFDGMDDPRWDDGETMHPLRTASTRYESLRKIANPTDRIV